MAVQCLGRGYPPPQLPPTTIRDPPWGGSTPGMILQCRRVSIRLYISSSVSRRFRLSWVVGQRGAIGQRHGVVRAPTRAVSPGSLEGAWVWACREGAVCHPGVPQWGGFMPLGFGCHFSSTMGLHVPSGMTAGVTSPAKVLGGWLLGWEGGEGPLVPSCPVAPHQAKVGGRSWGAAGPPSPQTRLQCWTLLMSVLGSTHHLAEAWCPPCRVLTQ